MPSTARIAALLLPLALLPSLAQAALLGSVSFAESYKRPVTTTPTTAASSISVRVSYSLAPGELEDPSTRLFETLTLDATAAGQRFVLRSPVDDPELAAFLARLTNGVDDDFNLVILGNTGGGRGFVAPEADTIVQTTPSGAPDLAGQAVAAVELYIASLVIDPTAAMGQVNWTVSGEVRFLSAAPVPLPASGLLLAAGACFGFRRRAPGATRKPLQLWR